jgi:C4-dicarboxylate-specific signal transduction histidine kinase
MRRSALLLPTLALLATAAAAADMSLQALTDRANAGDASVFAWSLLFVALLLGLAGLALPNLRRSRGRASARWRARVAAAEAGPGVDYRGIVNAQGLLRVSEIGTDVERLTGWTADAARLPDWRNRCIDPDSLTPDAEGLARLRNAERISLEYRFLRPDGGAMWLRGTLRVTARRAGEIAVAGRLVDISAERLLAQRAATAAKFATLGEMAAGLAHELNQPIAIMALAAENAAEALEAGEDGVAEALGRLRRIMTQADRAKAIVTQLRAFSRVDVTTLEPTDLGAAVHGLLVLAGQALRDAEVTVELRLPQALPRVIGQPVLVEQVLVNLALNARDALLDSPPERRRLCIEAAADTVAGEVTLRLIDSGPGLSAEVLDQVFEPFFTTKPPGLGTGLGLSISRNIMRGMGGRIAAENVAAPGASGAIFTLVFRIAPPASGAARSATQAAAAASA